MFDLKLLMCCASASLVAALAGCADDGVALHPMRVTLDPASEPRSSEPAVADDSHRLRFSWSDFDATLIEIYECLGECPSAEDGAACQRDVSQTPLAVTWSLARELGGEAVAEIRYGTAPAGWVPSSPDVAARAPSIADGRDRVVTVAGERGTDFVCASRVFRLGGGHLDDLGGTGEP